MLVRFIYVLHEYNLCFNVYDLSYAHEKGFNTFVVHPRNTIWLS